MGFFSKPPVQPMETTQHLLGPIWATFWPTKFKTHYVAPPFYLSADRPNYAKISFVEGRKEMFYLTTHSTHFIYGYMASDIWLTARVLLYAPFHRQDSTYHGLCYTSRGALDGIGNTQLVHHERNWFNDPSHHDPSHSPQTRIDLSIISYANKTNTIYYIIICVMRFIFKDIVTMTTNSEMIP